MVGDIHGDTHSVEGEITLEKKLELIKILRAEIQAAEENLDTMEINRLKLEARKLVEM